MFEHGGQRARASTAVIAVTCSGIASSRFMSSSIEWHFRMTSPSSRNDRQRVVRGVYDADAAEFAIIVCGHWFPNRLVGMGCRSW
jgi:hypothetical protein